MHERRLTPLDRLLAGINDALSTVAVPAGRAARDYPAADIDEGELDARAKAHAAGLLRVNPAGEIAAQGLYQGHAVVARDEKISAQMRQSAEEEFDHLAWCEQRLAELGDGPSKLNSLWYAGSFAIGAASGVFGDKWSLGFVAETEKQVVRHLDSHLAKLPLQAEKSRAILEQMREDEMHHATTAIEAGGAELPEPVRKMMGFTSKLMTKTVYWI